MKLQSRRSLSGRINDKESYLKTRYIALSADAIGRRPRYRSRLRETTLSFRLTMVSGMIRVDDVKLRRWFSMPRENIARLPDPLEHKRNRSPCTAFGQEEVK
jgi:hypothetical protein